jgi:excisionase family DNA binding protein
MTVNELASYLGVPAATIYRLLRQQKMPAYRVGAEWRFNSDSIDRWSKTEANPAIGKLRLR